MRLVMRVTIAIHIDIIALTTTTTTTITTQILLIKCYLLRRRPPARPSRMPSTSSGTNPHHLATNHIHIYIYIYCIIHIYICIYIYVHIIYIHILIDIFGDESVSSSESSVLVAST